MAKNIIKEIIIMLLLCLAIMLTMGIFLYEYIPIYKQLPETVAYTTPQDVKEELKTVDGVDEDTVVMTYEIDENDLSNYETINNYKPGKTNPFSTYETQTEENTTENPSQNGNTTQGTNTTQSGSSTSSNSTSSNSTSSTNTSNSTGYFPSTGLK